jgi:hypothetical protein
MTGREQVALGRRIRKQNSGAAPGQNQPALWSKRGGNKDLLPCQHNFVAKSTEASFEKHAPACEASALTTELTVPR